MQGTVSRKISFSPTITEITPTGRSTKKQDLQKLVAAKKRKPERSLPGSSDPPRNKTRVGPSDTQGEKGKSTSSGNAMLVGEITEAENGGGGKICEVYIGNRVEFQSYPDEQAAALQSFLAKRVLGIPKGKLKKLKLLGERGRVPAQSFLVRKKKKGGRELKLTDMNPELRGQFEQAMAKEWEGWLALNACEVIGPDAARKISKMKCLPCRFVLTDKNEMLREKGGDLPVLPKARLVALGNCDKNIAGHRTHAPTLSEAGTHLVFQRSASWKSDLFQGDVSQASLNGMNL